MAEPYNLAKQIDDIAKARVKRELERRAPPGKPLQDQLNSLKNELETLKTAFDEHMKKHHS